MFSPFTEAVCGTDPCVDAKMAFTFGLNGTEESEPRSKTHLSQAEIGTAMVTEMVVIEFPVSFV